MKPETKEQIEKTLQQLWTLIKRASIGLCRILRHIALGTYTLARTFCESRKAVSSAKEAARLANEEVEELRMRLSQAERESDYLRSELTSAREDAEAIRGDVSRILSALKRRKQALGDLLKHNLLHEEKPKGVIIDETIDAWWKDFRACWDKNSSDGCDDSDDEDVEDEDDEDNADVEDEDDEDNADVEDEDDDDESDEDDNDEGEDPDEDDDNVDEPDPDDKREEIENTNCEPVETIVTPESDGPEFLEKANDLFARLEKLPSQYDGFAVRFKDVDSGNWIQPERWYMDGEHGKLVFGLVGDGGNHDYEELSVGDLKNILTGGCLDDDDHVVWEDTPIYIDDPESDCYYRPLDGHFRIRRDRLIVEIPMSEDDNGEDDEDDEDGEDEDDDDYENEEGEDGEGEDDDEDGEDEEDDDYEDDNGEDGEDEGDDEDDEDEDDEDGEDDDADDYEDDEDEEAEDGEEGDDDENDGDESSDDNARDNADKTPSDIALGLVLGHAFEQWKSGQR